ncbi:MAG: YfhO family protein [Muribaculaceae bacterium]
MFFPWGWDCTIDGNKAEIGRVNYLLRAVRIPAGTHSIEMTFKPASVTGTVAAARVAVILIYLLVITAILWSFSKTSKNRVDKY